MDGRDWSLFLQPYEQAVEELKVKFKTLRTELKIKRGLCADRIRYRKSEADLEYFGKGETAKRTDGENRNRH